jgi:prepilin-type N-terminal cleavage/methylation domain-containing protein
MDEMKLNKATQTGFTLTELLVTIAIIGILSGLLLTTLAAAKKKTARIVCASNLGQIGKAFTGFAHDNNGRLPWQLTPLQAKHHFGDYYEEELGAIFSIIALKHEYQTVKVLHSPCDPSQEAFNEAMGDKWNQFNTRNGRKMQCEAISYLLVRGADLGRPATILATTRNLSQNDLAKAYWSGADEDPYEFQTMARLNRSEGQLALADGSVHQSNDADLGASGKRTAPHLNSTGGLSIGKANTQTIGCGSEVAIMIVYNESLYKIYGDAAGIQRRAKMAVAQVNTGLSRSGTDAHLRLVAVEPVEYTTAGNIGADLHKIRVDAETRELRDKHEADLVCLVSESGGGGVGFMGGGKAFGFSCIARHTLGGWTLGHEVGHNLGCPHRTGHAFTDGKKGFYTVMSMGPDENVPMEIRRRVRFQGILQFSNPDVDYTGLPSGTKSNNNAGIIRESAKHASKFYR